MRERNKTGVSFSFSSLKTENEKGRSSCSLQLPKGKAWWKWREALPRAKQWKRAHAGTKEMPTGCKGTLEEVANSPCLGSFKPELNKAQISLHQVCFKQG